MFPYLEEGGVKNGTPHVSGASAWGLAEIESSRASLHRPGRRHRRKAYTWTSPLPAVCQGIPGVQQWYEYSRNTIGIPELWHWCPGITRTPGSPHVGRPVMSPSTLCTQCRCAHPRLQCSPPATASRGKRGRTRKEAVHSSTLCRASVSTVVAFRVAFRGDEQDALPRVHHREVLPACHGHFHVS